MPVLIRFLMSAPKRKSPALSPFLGGDLSPSHRARPCKSHPRDQTRRWLSRRTPGHPACPNHHCAVSRRPDDAGDAGLHGAAGQLQRTDRASPRKELGANHEGAHNSTWLSPAQPIFFCIYQARLENVAFSSENYI